MAETAFGGGIRVFSEATVRVAEGPIIQGWLSSCGGAAGADFSPLLDSHACTQSCSRFRTRQICHFRKPRTRRRSLGLWFEGGADLGWMDASGVCDGTEGHLGRRFKPGLLEPCNAGFSVQPHLFAVLFDC